MNIAWGEIAYEMYRIHSDGKSLVSGALLPPWPELDPKIQRAWTASAQAVRQTCINLIGMEPDGPDHEAPALLDTRDASALRVDFEHRCAALARTLGLTALALEPLGSGSPVRWRIVLKGRERSYSIVAGPADGDRSSYVGCIMHRIDDGRGRDCADGPYENRSWEAILADIRSYETHGLRADMRPDERSANEASPA